MAPHHPCCLTPPITNRLLNPSHSPTVPSLCSLGFSTPNECSVHAKAAVAVDAVTATAAAAGIAVMDAETTTFPPTITTT